jgi:dihydroorotate dehydrogenase (NAD+) catalytic subunit
VLPRRSGGYTGPAILPVALARVDEIVRAVGIPVVGVGGIVTAADALKFFALGAVAVQVGTAQMRDPFAAAAIAADLRPEGGGAT